MAERLHREGVCPGCLQTRKLSAHGLVFRHTSPTLPNEHKPLVRDGKVLGYALTPAICSGSGKSPVVA